MVKRAATAIAKEQMHYGIAAFILARTVPILDLDDRSNGGSGVLLQLGQRYFVATAEHVIRPDHRYALLMREFDKKFDGIVAKQTDARNDVGVLELNPKSVSELLNRGHCFLGDEHLYLGRYPHISMPIRVTGFPNQKEMRVVNTRKVSRQTTIHDVAYGSLNFDTLALPRREWPRLASDSRPCKDGIDIFCSFDPHEDGNVFSLLDICGDPKPKKFGPVKLPGVSGGGIWIALEENTKGQISTPAALLVGIETSYSEDGRKKWLRGTRTRSLIQLLERHYPGIVGQTTAKSPTASNSTRRRHLA